MVELFYFQGGACVTIYIDLNSSLRQNIVPDLQCWKAAEISEPEKPICYIWIIPQTNKNTRHSALPLFFLIVAVFFLFFSSDNLKDSSGAQHFLIEGLSFPSRFWWKCDWAHRSGRYFAAMEGHNRADYDRLEIREATFFEPVWIFGPAGKMWQGKLM